MKQTRRSLWRSLILAVPFTLPLAGCSGLPEAGPSTSAVIQGGSTSPGANHGYLFTDLTEQIATKLNPPPAGQASAAFAALPAARPLGRIAPGDLLQITLWEANPAGTTLLSPPGLQVALKVDPSGLVRLPYAGVLRVAGRTPFAVQNTIVSLLNAQGHNIQAAVLDQQQIGDGAILAGVVARPGAYPLAIGSNSLLDVIAIAGGARQADDTTLVRLRRGDTAAEASLAEIDGDPTLDIPLEPGDTVTLLPSNSAFYAFGAVNRPGLFPYDEPRITLVKALAEVAGLQDNLAAPRGVFIYRAADQDSGTQTVYQLDLSRPESFFTAARFVLQPDDIIYVSDAPVANVSKVLQTISGVGGIAGMPRNFGAPY